MSCFSISNAAAAESIGFDSDRPPASRSSQCYQIWRNVAKVSLCLWQMFESLFNICAKCWTFFGNFSMLLDTFSLLLKMGKRGKIILVSGHTGSSRSRCRKRQQNRETKTWQSKIGFCFKIFPLLGRHWTQSSSNEAKSECNGWTHFFLVKEHGQYQGQWCSLWGSSCHLVVLKGR